MSYIEIHCSDVLSSVIFIIEDQMQELPHAGEIEAHIATCLLCQSEVAHERVMHGLLQESLRRSCDEKAPSDLHDLIASQLRAQIHGTSEVITQLRMTEVSIEIDEFGNVEHREIQIEQTHIQHFIENDPEK